MVCDYNPFSVSGFFVQMEAGGHFRDRYSPPPSRNKTGLPPSNGPRRGPSHTKITKSPLVKPVPKMPLLKARQLAVDLRVLSGGLRRLHARDGASTHQLTSTIGVPPFKLPPAFFRGPHHKSATASPMSYSANAGIELRRAVVELNFPVEFSLEYLRLRHEHRVFEVTSADTAQLDLISSLVIFSTGSGASSSRVFLEEVAISYYQDDEGYLEQQLKDNAHLFTNNAFRRSDGEDERDGGPHHDDPLQEQQWPGDQFVHGQKWLLAFPRSVRTSEQGGPPGGAGGAGEEDDPDGRQGEEFPLRAAETRMLQMKRLDAVSASPVVSLRELRDLNLCVRGRGGMTAAVRGDEGEEVGETDDQREAGQYWMYAESEVESHPLDIVDETLFLDSVAQQEMGLDAGGFGTAINELAWLDEQMADFLTQAEIAELYPGVADLTAEVQAAAAEADKEKGIKTPDQLAHEEGTGGLAASMKQFVREFNKPDYLLDAVSSPSFDDFFSYLWEANSGKLEHLELLLFRFAYLLEFDGLDVHSLQRSNDNESTTAAADHVPQTSAADFLSPTTVGAFHPTPPAVPQALKRAQLLQRHLTANKNRRPDAFLFSDLFKRTLSVFRERWERPIRNARRKVADIANFVDVQFYSLVEVETVNSYDGKEGLLADQRFFQEYAEWRPGKSVTKAMPGILDPDEFFQYLIKTEAGGEQEDVAYFNATIRRLITKTQEIAGLDLNAGGEGADML
eukprot:g16050.t1